MVIAMRWRLIGEFGNDLSHDETMFQIFFRQKSSIRFDFAMRTNYANIAVNAAKSAFFIAALAFTEFTLK